MLSLILTYRNRSLETVQKCLSSLDRQSEKDFRVFLIDYGSKLELAKDIKELCAKYNFVKYDYVPVQGQLWNKSRAINIGLRNCSTPYFLMGDIDLLYHPGMIGKCKRLMEQHKVVYFQYGFLGKNETEKSTGFDESQIEFMGNSEVTGTTLFQTEILKSVNGYDEFYHGWGAEDTDVHHRLKNAGYRVHFYDEEILVKHQWHSKEYRTKSSTAPFHTGLERINHRYMLQNEDLKVIKANQTWDWGIMPDEKHLKRLDNPTERIELSTQSEEIDAFLMGILPALEDAFTVRITPFKEAYTFKNRIKKALNRKCFQAYDLETVNNNLLSSIIAHHRLACYNYSIDWEKEEINLRLAPYVRK